MLKIADKEHSYVHTPCVEKNTKQIPNQNTKDIQIWTLKEENYKTEIKNSDFDNSKLDIAEEIIS